MLNDTSIYQYELNFQLVFRMNGSFVFGTDCGIGPGEMALCYFLQVNVGWEIW